MSDLKKCWNCGEKYHPTRSDQKYCCKWCRLEDYSDRKKAVREVEKESMTKCPHCGSEEYYVKTRIYGKCDHYRRFDGKETDNSGMHDNLTYVDGTIAYCAECKKRLFRLEEEC